MLLKTEDIYSSDDELQRLDIITELCENNIERLSKEELEKLKQKLIVDISETNKLIL